MKRSKYAPWLLLGFIVVVVTIAIIGSLLVSSTRGQDATLIKPGGPGGGTATAVPQLPMVSEDDVMFVAGMIPHHEQALVLLDLLTARAPDGETSVLAARMRASQSAELDLLRAWESSHSDLMHDHNHAHASGMATDAELKQLASLSGADAEVLFLQLMTRHHRGAVDMATTRLSANGESTITDYARNIYVEQSVEITRMGEILDRLTHRASP
jgi:uncharacterized protein (DUF305 family)